MGVSGLVDEGSCSWERKLFLWCEALVLMDRTLLLEGVFQRVYVRVGGFSHNLPGAVEILGRLTAASHLLSRGNEKLHSALDLGSGSSVPHGDGGGEDRLNDASGEMYSMYVIITFDRLNITCYRKYILCWAFSSAPT